MNKIRLVCVMALAPILFQAGCASRNQIETIDQICQSNIDKSKAMEIAEDVLRKMHFTISKADPQQGLIRTKPLPAAQSFEFWRADNVGRYNRDEANLHSIERIAELNISEQAGKVCINCNVQVYRLSLPERDITGGVSEYNLFSQGDVALKRLEIDGKLKEKVEWIKLPPDHQLQTRILQRIQTALK